MHNKFFYLYGLPRSGTNFLEKLVCQNFNVECFSEGPSGQNKHRRAPDPNHNPKNPTLVIYKNVYKWIESFVFRRYGFVEHGYKKKMFEKILNSDNNLILKNVIGKISKHNDYFVNKSIIIEDEDPNNEFLHKEDIIINQKSVALYWKKHFENFNKLENKEIIYYENLLLLKNRINFLEKLQQKYNFEPINSEWNVEVYFVPCSEKYNEVKMNLYYLQKNTFEFLKNNHLKLINDCFENDWLNTNTIYEMIYEISDYNSP